METPTSSTGRPARIPAFGIRSTPEWRAWANRLAESEDLNFSDLVARALRLYAREAGFAEPPPKR